MKATFAKLGIDASMMSPQEFGVVLEKERVTWADLAKQTGIKLAAE